MIRPVVIACLICIGPEAAAAQDIPAPNDSTILPVVAAVAIRGPHPSILWESSPADTSRPRAVELSDGYYLRLKIHQIGSYVMLPLFGAEFLLGQRLMSSTPAPDWVRGAHSAGAVALGGLFVVNTATGVWNLWEGRHVAQGKTRRWIHSIFMIAADAGFLYTASLAGDAREGEFEGGGGSSGNGATRHRNAAIVSMSMATVSTLMMWLWKG